MSLFVEVNEKEEEEESLLLVRLISCKQKQFIILQVLECKTETIQLGSIMEPLIITDSNKEDNNNTEAEPLLTLIKLSK